MTNYRRRRRPQKQQTKRYRVNKYIRHPLVKVIDENGVIGEMSSQEALKIAQERDLDLIEINPKTEPPIVKILDYSKFKYLQSKAEQNKKSKADKLKTIRVSVRIGPHDLEVQARKCDQFLSKDIKVKIQVQMRGREKGHPEVAEEVLYDFLNLIQENFSYIQEPKKIADSYFATINPKNN